MSEQTWNSRSNYALNLANGLSDRNFWYVFVWLLPLGVWRLNRLPRPWVIASGVTALLALGLGGYANLLGTVSRPLFNIAGPILSLSVANLLASGGFWGGSGRPAPRRFRSEEHTSELQ